MLKAGFLLTLFIQSIVLYIFIEITALRAKVAEMYDNCIKQQIEIRDRVRKEYDDLVQNFYSACFGLKNKFDEFR